MGAARVTRSILIAAGLLAGATAQAACKISNQTKYSFTVTSGNTSNQRVGGNTSTSIASGKILAKSDDGKKTFGGSCKDGDSLVVKEEDGVVYLISK